MIWFEERVMKSACDINGAMGGSKHIFEVLSLALKILSLDPCGLKISSLAKTAREYFGTGIFSDNSSHPEPRPPSLLLKPNHNSAKMNGPVFTPPGGNAQGADAQTMAAVKSVRPKLISSSNPI